MPPHTLPYALRRLEGRHVSVALRDGSRLEDCELVSVAGRRRGGSIWLLVGGDDHIVAVDDVLAVNGLGEHADTAAGGASG
ncbi:MAG TPA: hypothetical protein VGH94_02310 [Acidimicrobiales bacterium]|jgi:hypothetical protein